MTTTSTEAAKGGPADDDFKTETWVYAGVRAGDDGKATHAWAELSDPASPRLWSDRHAYAIGALYTVLVARVAERGENGADEVRLWRRGRPMPAGESLGDTDRIAEWEAASEAAQRRIRRAAWERKAKRDGGVIDEAAEGVCALAAAARSYDDLDLLVTAVRRRMMDAWGKGSAR